MSYEPHPGTEDLPPLQYSRRIEEAPPVETVEDVDDIYFEKKLEESLKDL